MTGRSPRRPPRAGGRRLALVPDGDAAGPTTLPARTGAPAPDAAPTSAAAPAHGRISRDGPGDRGVPAEPVPALLRDLLGARLRRARAAQGRSLRDVGAAAGVSPGHLSQVERGLAEASSEVLAALCRSLGVPLHVLLRAVAVDLTASAEPTTSAPAVTSLTSVRRTAAPPTARRPGGVRLAA